MPYASCYESQVRAIAHQHAPKLIQFYHQNKQPFNVQFNKHIKWQLAPESACVAIANNRVTGFVTYATSEPFINLFGARGHINCLAVAKNLQKKGHGTYLMKNVLRQFEQNEKIVTVTLCTTGDVEELLYPFYKKFGFQQGRTSKYSDWATWYKKQLKNPYLFCLRAIRLLRR